MSEDRTHELIIVGIYIASCVLVGTAMALVGPSLPLIGERAGVDLSGAGLVLGSKGIGYLAGSIAAGAQLEKYPKRSHTCMGISLLLTAFGLAIMPHVETIPLVCLAIALQGTTEGYFDTAANLMLIWLTKERMERYLHIIHAGFAFGALAGAPLLHLVGFSTAYYICAGLFVLLSIVIHLPGQPEKPEDPPEDGAIHEASNQSKCSRICNQRMRVVCCVGALLLLYVGVEQGFGGLVYTMSFDERYANMTDGESTSVNTVFWGSMAVGRLASSPISVYFNMRGVQMVVAGLTIMSIASVSYLVFPDTQFSSWVGAVLMGLGQAPIFPASVAAVEDAVTLSGAYATIVMLCSGAGGILVPPLFAFYYDQTESTVALAGFFVSLIVVMFALIVFFSYLKNKLPDAVVVVVADDTESQHGDEEQTIMLLDDPEIDQDLVEEKIENQDSEIEMEPLTAIEAS